MKPIIEHQMQPCPTSCVSTCLAMIRAIPADVVIEKYHATYRSHGLTLRYMLDDLGIQYEAFYGIDNPPLEDEGVYLCTAPSLNIEGGTHQILIELTDEDYFVIDPVMGREDRKFFVKRGAGEGNPLAIDLGGFIVEAFISREWLEGSRHYAAHEVAL